MKKIIIEESPKKTKVYKLLDWLLHMVGYGLILITLSLIFKKTLHIDSNCFGLWALLAAIIIYGLNRTIKPVIVWLTLPITGLTLGLFYPIINVIILNIADFLLGSHFDIKGWVMSFIVAVLISVMNIIMDSILENNIFRKR